jgi:3-methyladenine DNA glycosylase AlkD
MMNNVINELKNIANNDKALIYKRFFKTGKGEYGEGDQFLGITVPNQRKIAKKYYKDISLSDIDLQLKSKYHEIRLTALFMLNYKMLKAKKDDQTKIYDLYLKNIKYINNWDLVDVTAPNIIGYYLYENNINRHILYQLANSKNLWEQRIAILSTLYFIKRGDFNDTLKISKTLLNHPHDLIHKAVGWMLREVGNRDYNTEYIFLLKHYRIMPRTMLRYAIEKFDQETRLKFLKNLV